MLFDLDGTLVDSVYQHVLAWREALEAEGIDIPVWTIHRRIGMSGGLFARALLREVGAPITPEVAERLQARHHDAFERYRGGVRPLPGALDLLERLTALGTPWAIATSGRLATAAPNVASLRVPEGVPVITRDAVARAKPDPDLFLGCGRGAWPSRRGLHRGGGQRVGPAGRPPGPRPGRRPPVRRVWHR